METYSPPVLIGPQQIRSILSCLLAFQLLPSVLAVLMGASAEKMQLSGNDVYIFWDMVFTRICFLSFSCLLGSDGNWSRHFDAQMEACVEDGRASPPTWKSQSTPGAELPTALGCPPPSGLLEKQMSISFKPLNFQVSLLQQLNLEPNKNNLVKKRKTMGRLNTSLQNIGKCDRVAVQQTLFFRDFQ